MIKRRRLGGARAAWLSGLVLTLVIAACLPPGGTPPATGLPAQVASQKPPPAPTSTSRQPAPTAAPTSTADRSPLGPHPFPARLAQIPLAPAGQVLGHLLLDPEGGRLYITDSTGMLHVLDSTTYEEVATVPVASSWDPAYETRESLALDAARQRLYVAAETRPQGVVTVVDTAELRALGSITPGGAISLDPGRERLYVGRAQFDNPIWDASYAPLSQATGKVYDAETLAELADLPVKGRPVYDPLADELLIVSFTVLRVDPDSLQIEGDLLPDVSAQPCPECSGVSSATEARLDLEQNLITVQLQTSVAGHSVDPPPDRTFDATTLEPMPDPSLTPPFAPACNGRRKLPAAVRERAYIEVARDGYAPSRSLSVVTLDGEPVTTLEGITLGLLNPNTCQSYVRVGDRVVVLDLPDLAPVGSLPPAAYTLDAGTGRLYGLAGADLLVFAESGGQPEVPPPEPAELPDRAVTLIRPSPGYAKDRTIFVGVGQPPDDRYNLLYRSTDGGESWVLLRGGLPNDGFSGLDLAVSPGFAADRTLFAGGIWGTAAGLGVFRSIDGGDSWKPVNVGLRELPVDDLILSPDYPQDGTLLALTHGGPAWAPTSRSLHLSTDRGKHRARVGMGDAQDIAGLLPAGSKEPPATFRLSPVWSGPGGGVERRVAGTPTWQAVYTTDQDTSAPVSVLPSPAIEADHTVYLLTRSGFWRSANLGQTWERCPRPKLDDRTHANWVTAGALAGELVFVGTMDGELLTLDLTKRCVPQQ